MWRESAERNNGHRERRAAFASRPGRLLTLAVELLGDSGHAGVSSYFLLELEIPSWLGKDDEVGAHIKKRRPPRLIQGWAGAAPLSTAVDIRPGRAG